MAVALTLSGIGITGVEGTAYAALEDDSGTETDTGDMDAGENTDDTSAGDIDTDGTSDADGSMDVDDTDAGNTENGNADIQDQDLSDSDSSGEVTDAPGESGADAGAEDTAAEDSWISDDEAEDIGKADSENAGSGEEDTVTEDPDLDLGIPASGETEEATDVVKESLYANYYYGDPDCSKNFVWEYDADGDAIYEYYEDDLDTIIAMAEEGMELSMFFRETVFANFTLDTLYEIRDTGITLEEAALSYLVFDDLSEDIREEMTTDSVSPISAEEWQEMSSSFSYSNDDLEQKDDEEYSASENDSDTGGSTASVVSGTFNILSASGSSSTLTASGTVSMISGVMGVQSVLGGSNYHGALVKLLATDGTETYEGFCGRYGGSYKTGYVYTQAGYSELVNCSGVTLTSAQNEMIQSIVSYFVTSTPMDDACYIVMQVLIWYIIQNPEMASGYSADSVWGDLETVVYSITNGNTTVISAAYTRYAELESYQSDGSVTVSYWKSSTSNSQYFLTWDAGETTAEGAGIPSIDNYYAERTAVSEYYVEITKESVITNELLEGIQFEIVESEADGYEISDYFITGEYADGSDYEEASVEEGSFGQTTTGYDSAPYMDDPEISGDIEISTGTHSIIVETDSDGHAEAEFVHEHTFMEYYSVVLDGDGNEISYSTYESLWAEVLTLAATAAASGLPLTTTYRGQTYQMTYEEIYAIYTSQQVVYTQTKSEAMSTLSSLYNAYKSRTYTYTVAELDGYVREGDADGDSNRNELAETSLPKEGYRKDVSDVTTVGEYVEILSEYETMIPGGENDSDEDTEGFEITDEPWQNQIFINKTDLESGNQILYDTKFEIYEYYQYGIEIDAAKAVIYPAQALLQYISDSGSTKSLDIDPDTITYAYLTVYSDGGSSMYETELDVDALAAAMKGDYTDYAVIWETTHTGTFSVIIEFSTDTSTASDAQTLVLDGAALSSWESCGCEDECLEDSCPVCAVDTDYCFLETGISYCAAAITWTETVTETVEEYSGSLEGGDYQFTTSAGYSFSVAYDSESGEIAYTDLLTGYVYSSTDGAVLYTCYDDDLGDYLTSFTYGRICGGIYLISADGGDTYETVGTDDYSLYTFTSFTLEDGTCTLTYLYGSVGSGSYEMEWYVTVSDSDITYRNINYDVDTDIDDYTTWGQENYAIVRVTAEIAREMGWGDETIGMYTVEYLNYGTVDAYTGTTFTDTADWATGEAYGLNRYGTLYYTQSNLGYFAIVESDAPYDDNENDDGSYDSGYLGNYSDRDYTKLDETSSEKNDDAYGDPYATDDETSSDLIVHYIHLCADTNQYATYMLTDGFEDYDSVYYANYVETLDDPAGTGTGDGYDADYYEQSALEASIAYEDYTVESETILNDVLNDFWDDWFNSYFLSLAGVTTDRDSGKTDTYFGALKKSLQLITYAGTTVNVDSYDDNDSAESEIYYNGSYTETEINYGSYAGEDADALNVREGFNGTDYLQAGTVTYDDGEAEKEARYYNTEDSVTGTDQGFAFIDERTYAYIRFTKYDTEAERYVTGDLEEGYAAGTDHGDADLDGAVYSLYVDESNEFTVEYLEGTYDGTLVWAQPLNTGGFRLIYDADGDASNGFTDEGDNETEDCPDAYLLYGDGGATLYLDYNDGGTDSFDIEINEQTYSGIQHPDGQYGGAKHNGWYAVLEEQQVFIDADADGYGDTWTIQDVTLAAGAKVASATIADGEIEFNGLYLGDYYIAEEIRDSIAVWSYDNDGEESVELKWLSFAAGYLADTDDDGNPTKYHYSFTYEPETVDGEAYADEQVYVEKETTQVSNQQVVKGAGFQINKQTSAGDESGGSTNSSYEALEGAGFTVYLISELSLITDGTIEPAFTEDEGHELVKANILVALYDDDGNLTGYRFTDDYIAANDPFGEKYGDDYDLDEVNSIVYVADRGYYYTRDILDAYENAEYSNYEEKWDFSGETLAIARMYEDDADYVEEINADYDYVDNRLNSGSPCEWYGKNGISDGWVSTGVKYEYVLSELFTNHNGYIRSPELPWGAYIVVETTTPADVFTVDPVFVTVSDSSATENRTRYTTLTDESFVASLVLVKRDAQSGQDVLQDGVTYRIWDYQNSRYITQYLLGEDGNLSTISRSIFTTDDEGRLNAVASLQAGYYRIEEVGGPEGYYNEYWDAGNETDGETLGGVNDEDAGRDVEDNTVETYLGTVEFEVTTERLYKSSGITSSGNLDYIYIGETYYNDEAVGKITILKTGEVLVGYESTDDIEYADEYTDADDEGYNASKASAKDRSVFESLKEYYDLGTDGVTYREITLTVTVESITEVDYIATDANGVRIAAVYTDADGNLVTLNGGHVYTEGILYTDADGNVTYYPGAYLGVKSSASVDEDGNETVSGITTQIVTADGEYITLGDGESAEEITAGDGILMIVYGYSTDVYTGAALEEAEDTYAYTVAAEDTVSTVYLVTLGSDGMPTTADGGVLADNGDGTYTLTYTEAVYDPDTNYSYVLTLSDGTETDVKYVTYGVYLTADGEVVRALGTGGYSVTDSDGNVTEYADATVSLSDDEENTGATYDFVYEERPLADATYVITAAEDIYTQDGNGGTWFKEGDVVATVTTGEDGEIVSFAPNYSTADDAGGGTYDYTYYYGEGADYAYTSLTSEAEYGSSDFATTGSIDNYWTEEDMEDLDISLYGVPVYDDGTVYANTFYREGTYNIMRRIYRSSSTAETVVTDYVNRLEDAGNLSSESAGTVTETADGYRITWTDTDVYDGAELVAASEYYGTYNDDDYYLLVLDGEDYTIEVEASGGVYRITESAAEPWTEGDIVEKTAKGYMITHTDAMEAGVDAGSTTDAAYDLGYTTVEYYGNASLTDNGDGTWTLYDEDGNMVCTMEGGVLMTEYGGYVYEMDGGYEVVNAVYEEFTDNAYVDAELDIRCAELTVKTETYDLVWDSLNQRFVTTASGTYVTVADDYSYVTVTTGTGDDAISTDYKAFDLFIEYDLDYAAEEDIVTVENDGTLGTVSVYLPLGTYNIEEVSAPYGFLITEYVQTVELEYADQIKEVVFNTAEESTDYTAYSTAVWASKGLEWFLGGFNTVGEKLDNISGVNFWTWGTYGDAEEPFYDDEEGFVTFYNLRVKAWSTKDVPDSPEGAEPSIGTTALAEDTDGHITVADGSVTITDEIAYEGLTAGGIYTVEGILYTSDGTVFTDADGSTVAVSLTFTATGESGSVYLTFTFDATGLEGTAVVAYEYLYEGEYSDGDDPIAEHEDPDDGDQTVELTDGENPYIGTRAEDSATGADYAYADGSVTIVDTVSYVNLEEGRTYILSGTLMDKSTGEEFVDADGNTVTAETAFTAAEGGSGSVEMTYTFNAEDLEGMSVVVFETLCTVKGEVVAEHADIDDGGQTVELVGHGDRHSDGNQWYLGVGIYKTDADSGESLAGAKFGLYTANDIYNVDGMLLVEAGTLLAVATTDEGGFANFAVDIALMSKYLDEDESDAELIYEKYVEYTYASLTEGAKEGTYLLEVEGADTVTVTAATDEDGGILYYVTDDGHVLYIDGETMTVSYLIEESIDGNTSINTGDYYIQEITPPDGYLIDDTIYYVDFEYDDQYTMYIPVYAEHTNVETEVGITKYDLTGEEEVEGAVMAVYKVVDVYDTDADGLISHEDDNLELIETWETTDGEHTVTGLLLSNTEWPRLSNQEVRENVYVFRELSPANGYATAEDIEFKIYQICGEDGSWFDEDGNLYGYEVLVNHVTCDQDYLEGAIVAANENADDWILNGESENGWDYTETLGGYTLVKWLLVNWTLVLHVDSDATYETLAKVLKEEDFADYEFTAVYVEGTDLELDFFYYGLQADERPEDSYLTYTKVWMTLDELHLVMYDDTTKLTVTKQDIVTGAEVDGATLAVYDAETAELIDTWTTGDDGYDDDGNPLDHYIEGVLAAGRTYILVETSAPTEDGYATSNSVEFTVDDTGAVQAVFMEDDFTKLEISKTNITTGVELAGAVLQIWTADADGNPAELVEQWTTGDDGYNSDGTPVTHVIDYLPVGDYVLAELSAPEGFLVSENVTFTVADTGILQTVEMEDSRTGLVIYKYETGTTNPVSGATISIYSVPEEYVEYLTGESAAGTSASVTAYYEEETDDTETDGGGTVYTDLSAYLTAAYASGTEYAGTYGTTLTLAYTLTAEDIEDAGYTLTHALPDEITVPDGVTGTEYTSADADGGTAFTYTLTETGDGYALTVTFDEGYVSEYESLGISITFAAEISAGALTSGGSLYVEFTDSVTLTVYAAEITAAESELTEDADSVVITLTSGDLVETFETTDGEKKIYGLDTGWYIAFETAAPDGYVLDETPQAFYLLAASGEQALYFYNSPAAPETTAEAAAAKTPSKSSGGGGSSEPEIGILTLSINSGWWWNNVRTEDTGEYGFSITLEAGTGEPAAAETRIYAFTAGAALIAAGAAGYILIYRRRRSGSRG